MFLSVGKPVRQVVVSEDIAVPKNLWSFDEVFEYVVKYVVIVPHLLCPFLCRRRIGISSGTDKASSTEKWFAHTTIIKQDGSGKCKSAKRRHTPWFRLEP